MQSNYEILSSLGSGTFGRVYKCKHISSGRVVAVKELLRDKFRELVIVNEVDILRKLISHGIRENHFIVQTLDIIEEPSRISLVFELLDESLYHFMKNRKFRPLPLHNIRTVAYQLFSALQRLLELSLLHTDIKPENIMLVNHAKWPFRVKLIDFGSASRSATARIYRAPYIQSRFYRSPEILLGSSFSEAVDMWSVGCVLGELSIGHPLYPGSCEYDQIRFIADMQGNFPNKLLEGGRKSKNFFVFTQHKQNDGNSCSSKDIYDIHTSVRSWRLKTPYEYETDSGIVSKETRKYRFLNLAQLAQWRQYKDPHKQTTYNDSIELCDSMAFADLLQRTLSLEPGQRIKPSFALHHDFVTASHLRSFDGRSEYITKTNNSSNQAFGFPIVPMYTYSHWTFNHILPNGQYSSCIPPWRTNTHIANQSTDIKPDYSSQSQNRGLGGIKPVAYAQLPYPFRILLPSEGFPVHGQRFAWESTDQPTHTNPGQRFTTQLRCSQLRNECMPPVYPVDSKYDSAIRNKVEAPHPTQTDEISLANDPVYFPSSEINFHFENDHDYCMKTKPPNTEHFPKSNKPPEDFDSAILYSLPIQRPPDISSAKGDAAWKLSDVKPLCDYDFPMQGAQQNPIQTFQRANMPMQIARTSATKSECPDKTNEQINSQMDIAGKKTNLSETGNCIPCSHDVEHIQGDQVKESPVKDASQLLHGLVNKNINCQRRKIADAGTASV